MRIKKSIKIYQNLKQHKWMLIEILKKLKKKQLKMTLGPDYVEKCMNRGRAVAGRCRCNALYYGDRCQYKDECASDQDCGRHGKCVDVRATTSPRRQCFCAMGWFGPDCTKREFSSWRHYTPQWLHYLPEWLENSSEISWNWTFFKNFLWTRQKSQLFVIILVF